MESPENLLNQNLQYLSKISEHFYAINRTVLNELVSKYQYTKKYNDLILWTFINSFKHSNKNPTLKDWIILSALNLGRATYICIKHNTIYCLNLKADSFYESKMFFYVFDMLKNDADPIILLACRSSMNISSELHDQLFLEKLYDTITPSVKDIPYWHINIPSKRLRYKNTFTHIMLYVIYYTTINDIYHYQINNIHDSIKDSLGLLIHILRTVNDYINGYVSNMEVDGISDLIVYRDKTFISESPAGIDTYSDTCSLL